MRKRMMYAFDDRSDRSFVVASEELLELGAVNELES